jgi:hypothetical protein
LLHIDSYKLQGFIGRAFRIRLPATEAKVKIIPAITIVMGTGIEQLAGTGEQLTGQIPAIVEIKGFFALSSSLYCQYFRTVHPNLWHLY